MNTLESSVLIGLNAGAALTTGTNNTVVSAQTGGQALTTGSDNTIVGENSGPAITTGSNNTLIGSTLAASLTTGGSNTVVGKGLDLSAAAANVVAIADGAGQVRFDYGKTTASVATITAPVAVNPVAIAAGSAATPAVTFSSTANFGIFFGSGAPSFAAAQGSLYVRSDGSSTSTRLYVNTTGSTTWTNVTTAA